MNDLQLRQGIRSRDPAAWTFLSQTYGAALTRQARLILPDGMDPENAVGEVWLRALKAARRYETDLPPYPWLANICLKACLRQRRRFLLFGSSLERLDPPTGFGSEPQALRSSRAALRRALQALPRRERQVVTLRFLFEVSVTEMAQLLGIQANSVQQTLLRGLEHLRL